MSAGSPEAAGGSDAEGYELTDAGGGRKLERFGSRLLDRPCPAASWEPALRRDRWKQADARYERRRGWTRVADDSEWSVRCAGLVFRLQLGASGQVGLFPEHRACWNRIEDRLGPGDRLLNLFAHTGGATMVAARKGAEVCHVDGSRPAVARARDNAAANGLADRPVRWIIDDVSKFVAREIRRGRRYEAVLLDPPAFGRGPGGERWKLEEVLDGTLARLFELLSENPRFVLLSAHSRGLDDRSLATSLGRSAPPGRVERGELTLEGASAPAAVPAGCWAAWEPVGP